jgi:uncharacterized protein (DUF4415 family)
MKERVMKKISKNNEKEDDLLPEYNIDYSKAVKNPYFKRDRVFIEVDKDVADLFQNTDNINDVLKAIAKSFPKSSVAIL